MSANGATAKPQNKYIEVGFSGLQTYGFGSPTEVGGVTLPPELTGVAWRRVLQVMSQRDAVIHGVLLAIDTLVRQVEWTVENNPAHPNEQYRKFVAECLNDMSAPWGDTLSEILSFLVYGYAYHEVVYGRRLLTDGSKYDDGLDRWKKFAIRGQNTIERWEIDRAGGIQAFWQFGFDWVPVRIPIDRALLFRTRSHLNNPEGPSILNGAYEQWRMKWHVQRMEGIGIERELAGIPIAWGPPEMWDPEHPQAAKFANLMAHLQTLVTQIKVDENRGIVFPLMYTEEGGGHKVYDLTLLRSGGTRQIDTDAVIDRFDHRILTSVLADWLLLGQNTVGSFALADTKTDLFAVALGTFLDHIGEIVSRFAIPPLLRRNGWDQRMSPVLKHGDIERVDLVKLGALIDTLVKAGARLTETQTRWMMRQGGLPDAQPGERVMPDPVAPPPAPAGPSTPSTTPPARPNTPAATPRPPQAPTRPSARPSARQLAFAVLAEAGELPEPDGEAA